MIRSIQLLRAVAALFVVNKHLSYVLLKEQFGTFGVDIFFVISGFIIAFLIKKNINGFIAKRVIKIFPLYLIFSLLQFTRISLPGHVGYENASFRALITSILFINSEPVLGIGWTLNFEMFFYFLVFVFSLINVKWSIYLTSFTIITGVVVNILTGNVFSFLPLNYFGSTILLEFVLGVILFRIKDRFSINGMMALFFLMACLITLIHFELNTPITASNRFFKFGIPAFGICVVFLTLENRIKQGNFWDKSILIGDSSYVIYLFHSFVILGFQWLLVKKIATDPLQQGILFSVFFYLLIMILVIILSILIHIFFEKRLTLYLRRICNLS